MRRTMHTAIVLCLLNNCISSWCCKNGVDKSFFLEWANNVKIKTDERISHLANNLYDK